MQSILHHCGPIGKQLPLRLKQLHKLSLGLGIGCIHSQMLLPQVHDLGGKDVNISLMDEFFGCHAGIKAWVCTFVMKKPEY